MTHPALNRRDLMRMAGAAGLAGAAASVAGSPVFARGTDPVFAAFEANSETDPWTLGLTDAPAGGRQSVARLVHGRAPAGLEGTLYRNGPGRFSRQGWRYRHWFDGDGFLQSWRIGGGEVVHHGRFAETEKWQREEAAGRFLAPAFGSVPPGAGGLTGPDDMNVANTSVMMLGDELLALWEGGSAWSIDPDTLDARGPRRWGHGLDGVHFSAHPKRESRTGIVWNFGQDAARDRLVMWQIAPDGSLMRGGLINDIPGGMIHDFAITERSLVFLVGSLRHQTPRLPFIHGFAWQGDTPMRAIVIDKNDWTRRRSWDLPPGFLFHVGGAWEEADGTVRIDAAISPDATMVLDTVRGYMRGEPRDREDGHTRMQLITLRPDGRSSIDVLDDWLAEFPQVDPRFTDRRRRFTWHIGWTPDQIRGATRIMARDLAGGRTDSFDYGPGIYVEEPLFLPARAGAAEGEGWLVHTALNAHERATELHVLDARRLGEGPVASWRLPYACPFGFHGCWRPGRAV